MQKDFFRLENLGEEYASFSQEIRRGTPTAVFGIQDGVKYLLASLIDYPVLYVTADSVSAQKAVRNAAAISGKDTALIRAKDEVLSYQKALSKEALFQRVKGLDALQNGCAFVAAEIDALVQLFPKKLPVLTLSEGEEFPFEQLPKRLTEMGYIRAFEVENAGVFALRGDILDIFPVGAENPVRIDFFGDTVERIKPYDLSTGKRLETVKTLRVLSACDTFVTEEDLPRIKGAMQEGLKGFTSVAAYERAKEIAGELESDLQSSYLLPLIQNSTDIFPLLPENTVVVIEEGKQIWDKLDGLYKERDERFARLKEGGEAFEFCKRQYVEKDELLAGLQKFRCVALQTFTGNPFLISPLKIFNLSVTPMAKYYNAVPTLLTDLKNWLKGGYRVLLYCGDESRAAKWQEVLREEYLPLTSLPKNAEEWKGISLSVDGFESGFVLHGCKTVIVGVGDLYTKATQTTRLRRKRGDMFSAPEVGDYAVHETHGIGKVIGTKKLETLDGIKEYIGLEYKGGDTLYVPVENMDVLSKYVGEENPSLSKIGGADFERVKERVRKSLKQLAFDLKKLYADRASARGFAFPDNEVFMQEFEAAFPHELTPDQAASVAEIKGDMYAPKVMDRLLCGDVGFGKTEVAFRAVFLAVLAGKQAALLCPSTVLCAQHFNTAKARFESFGVRVGMLSRFNGKKQQERTLEELKEGKLDLIVGTHRLLSDDVQFANLGLLVLDEEQRFGVEHKEKIKNLRKDIDCLTMTATPIPRTLHMSLSGIRDISTIHTPPGERLPVQTYVVEETETLIRDVVLRELARGGQVFLLYNRVESIATFAHRIGEILPEAKIGVAHGRMEKTALENAVYDFYGGKTNLLITTTIIENGIDLPNANTIIVIDSDRLGISQLYQLKGRVGRGARLAYAYFTYKAHRVMSDNASARLRAIMEFTELGSGYKLAMRDLEIRGAGNVLGSEQHGHMDRVGYELYSKLLKEEMTGERHTLAELDLQVSAYIAESYIESSAGRLDAYKQIAEIRTLADYKRVYDSLKETYGELPVAVGNLLVIAVLKSYAQNLGVQKISIQKGVGSLQFPSVEALGKKGVLAAVEQFQGTVRLNMTSAPVVEVYGAKNHTQLMAEMTKFLKFALSFTKE